MDFVIFFFFKQKTAYEMRISDWSSDVCSSISHLYTEVMPGLEVQYREMTALGPYRLGGFITYGSRVTASAETVPGSRRRDARGYVYGNGQFRSEARSCRERVCQYV